MYKVQNYSVLYNNAVHLGICKVDILLTRGKHSYYCITLLWLRPIKLVTKLTTMFLLTPWYK
jgi:hypothetical protein